MKELSIGLSNYLSAEEQRVVHKRNAWRETVQFMLYNNKSIGHVITGTYFLQELIINFLLGDFCRHHL